MRAVTSRTGAALTATAGGAALTFLVCVVSFVACGNGDDTTSLVPFPDAGAPHDATIPTASDACIPEGGDAARCNTCATPATDPYNACSTFTGGCIPFDAARVPSHSMF